MPEACRAKRVKRKVGSCFLSNSGCIFAKHKAKESSDKMDTSNKLSEVVWNQLSPSVCDPLVGNLSSIGMATSNQHTLTQHPEEILVVFSECKTEDEFVTKVKHFPLLRSTCMLCWNAILVGQHTTENFLRPTLVDVINFKLRWLNQYTGGCLEYRMSQDGAFCLPCAGESFLLAPKTCWWEPAYASPLHQQFYSRTPSQCR